jgi:hypothetical protein
MIGALITFIVLSYFINSCMVGNKKAKSCKI